MPGLSQLQQFKSNLLSLGDEVKLRAARGEKPSDLPIPTTIQDIDDSDDFRGGMPEISEEEIAQRQAQEEAKKKEAEDFSDITGEPKDAEIEEIEEIPETGPDMSNLLPDSDSMTMDDIDLSDFEEQEEAVPEEPEEIPMEDMDFDALMASAAGIPEEPAEEVASEPQVSAPSDDFIADDTFSTDSLDSNAETTDFGGFGDFGNFNFEEPSEIPSIDDDLNGLSGFDAPADLGTDDFNIDSLTETAETIPGADDSVGSNDVAELESEEPSPETESMDDFDFGGLNKDFEEDSSSADGAMSMDLTDDLPKEFKEEPDPLLEKLRQEKDKKQEKENASEIPSIDDDLNELAGFDIDNMGITEDDASDEKIPDGFIVDSSGDANLPPEDSSDSTGEEFIDIDSLDNLPSMSDLSSDDSISLDPEPAAGTDSNDELAGMDFNTDGLDDGSFGTDDISLPDIDGFGDTENQQEAVNGLDLDLESMGFQDGDLIIDETSKQLSPEDDVPEEPVESFDTSDIAGLDFSGDNGGSEFSFGDSFGDSDDDEFSIPGFSDTVTAKLDKKPDLAKPDFSGAKTDDDAKPKNTFTDAEYKKFLRNLETYPLNVRIAIENLVVKNEFTDDAVFSILEKVLRRASAKQVASELEKLLDITLDVPRDFERRSATEYEEYKKSIEYQLKNRIIPGAILTAAAAVLVFCIFTFINTFIYKPLRAESLYKQGYELLSNNEYPQSEERFNQALTYKPKKPWFYKYAEGYRDHKQYDRARMMYKAILMRYKHEKQAGLDWAQMELNDLMNYEETERILKREVLDYYINDQEGILALGDAYLEWATEKDPEKFQLAKEQYDLLMQLYGNNNVCMSRQMRYYIRTDNLRQVLAFKEAFMRIKKGYDAQDAIELSGYLMDKRYGKLRSSEEGLRSAIEDVRTLLEKALKAAPDNPVAHYNMARYFVNTNNGKGTKRFLESAIMLFEKQTRRNKRDTYRYINAYRLLGEEYVEEKEYLTAEENYGKGIEIFEKEHKSSGFPSNENIGHLYADLADIDYFISADNDAALHNYENAVNNKWDTSSVRYRIGYIQYNKENYPEALGSFIKSSDTAGRDSHLLLALANTLSLSSNNYIAEGHYNKLLKILETEKQKYNVILPQVRSDQADLVETYMKATNNLGVTLSRLANETGDSQKNAKAIVWLQESLRAWDSLTRNQDTMVRLEGSNLAEQNIKYIIHPYSEYEPEIYTSIPRTLADEEGIE